MTQSTTPSTQSSYPLPDVFSSALTALFDQARPAIVQVRNGQHGGGTGIVWRPDGQIITNNHVVPRDGGDIQVHFTDGRTLPARVIQRQPEFDLALLKVAANDLPFLEAGDSSKLRVGEWVFAIGHPWGQRWTVTAGIMSSRSTRQIDEDVSIPYIKSDVRLAPGNSGGPLLNADGDVVGVNAMIFGGDLSVSIPSNVVSEWLSGLPKAPAILGVGLQRSELPANVQAQLAASREYGQLVVSVVERVAAQQEIFLGDLLLDIDGQPIESAASLRRHLASKAPGDNVSLTLIRGGILTTISASLLPVSSAN
ncbi:hypothetical protein KDA_45140 [Dictyobacter alpinus]|uniref:PDZ domain-containing protein n=1 Tax=Dictyobacter alpinus TaxID=2014873 RepID=A0A402BCK0_9CHLR|nr:trypsin-like peptidase domain-containing protein [Dictyobacter alpinus]GCE29030.1 hypothetical protein KDA_45140 [Dictyobacter alpinus]